MEDCYLDVTEKRRLTPLYEKEFQISDNKNAYYLQIGKLREVGTGKRTVSKHTS